MPPTATEHQKENRKSCLQRSQQDRKESKYLQVVLGRPGQRLYIGRPVITQATSICLQVPAGNLTTVLHNKKSYRRTITLDDSPQHPPQHLTLLYKSKLGTSASTAALNTGQASQAASQKQSQQDLKRPTLPRRQSISGTHTIKATRTKCKLNYSHDSANPNFTG